MIDQDYYELDHLHKYWTHELGIDNQLITHMLRDGSLPCYVYLDGYNTTALIKENGGYTPVARCTAHGIAAAASSRPIIINLESGDIRDWSRICNDPTKKIEHLKFDGKLIQIIYWNATNPHYSAEEKIDLMLEVEPTPPYQKTPDSPDWDWDLDYPKIGMSPAAWKEYKRWESLPVEEIGNHEIYFKVGQIFRNKDLRIIHGDRLRIEDVAKISVSESGDISTKYGYPKKDFNEELQKAINEIKLECPNFSHLQCCEKLAKENSILANSRSAERIRKLTRAKYMS